MSTWSRCALDYGAFARGKSMTVSFTARRYNHELSTAGDIHRAFPAVFLGKSADTPTSYVDDIYRFLTWAAYRHTCVISAGDIQRAFPSSWENLQAHLCHIQVSYLGSIQAHLCHMQVTFKEPLYLTSPHATGSNPVFFIAHTAALQVKLQEWIFSRLYAIHRKIGFLC